ncbi:MAG: peptide deformylase [Acidiferrobacterales bacterium]|nr:peptide deformylase [Acidiferrobacterales bacterium]
MAIRRILKMGDPQLLQVSSPVLPAEIPQLGGIIEDMIETMNDADGAGLAAPQIGVMKRIVIFGVDHNPRYPHAESVPFTILINPSITPLDEEFEQGWEGCLSVPGLRGLVSRHANVHYTGLNERGERVDRTVSGFHARVVQHECDHLDGILYPLRVTDMRNFGFEEELAAQPLDCPPYEELELA